jgi:hypothetical protein
MIVLHWVPQLQVQMHLIKPTTISIMGSYTSGNTFISSCILLKSFIGILYCHFFLVCEFATHDLISSSVLSQQNLFQVICLEAFVATIFNKIFLVRQLHQSVKMFQYFRDWLCSHLQMMMMKMKIGTESVLETLEHLYILTRLSARKYFSELFQVFLPLLEPGFVYGIFVF